MKLYVGGDSNVAGYELKNPENSFSYKLGQMLGATETIVQAVGGASNDKILSTTQSYLASCETFPDLVVIGWSSVERQDRFVNGSYVSLNNLGVVENVTRIEDDYRYQYFLKHQAHNYDYHREMHKYWQNRIYNYHLELLYYKIPHLFFNAIHSFGFWEGTLEHLVHDWDNTFITPYDKRGSYIEYCEDNGYQEITPGWHHFNEDAHQDWANILYQYIKTYNLIGK